MLSTSASLALGFAFLLVGGINVWLVLEAWSQVKAPNISSRMLTLHRIGGYVFLGLFCVMTYFMMTRLRSGGTDISATVTIHLALAMILSPLLFIKVLIARYYRNQHGLLMAIGLTIFVFAFVLIGEPETGQIQQEGESGGAEAQVTKEFASSRCVSHGRFQADWWDRFSGLLERIGLGRASAPRWPSLR